MISTMYTHADLPTGQDIFNQLRKINDCKNLKDLQTLKDWAFKTIEIIKNVISQCIEKNEYREDPDLYQERIVRYHYLNSGLMGFVDGLYDKAMFLEYKELLDNMAVQKLTAGDRELYAKGSCADLKGLKRDLEETQRNLWERIQITKNNRR